MIYYVSSSLGDDKNDGTDPGKPWKTVARVNRAIIKPGDNVRFYNQDTFSDATLMPAQSGTGNAWVVYGYYGNGSARPTITKGVFFAGPSWIDIRNLTFGAPGFQGGNSKQHSDNSALRNCTILGGGALTSNVGVNITGNNWAIKNNVVQSVGNSGMLLTGDRYTVTGNKILDTGLNGALTFGKHGIYLDASNALVDNNAIQGFSSDGVSCRYRNATVTHNTITHGAIGIAWFQYDKFSGTSTWSDNVIRETMDAGMYVSASDQAGKTRESFIIENNQLQRTTLQWNATDLQATTGTYQVQDNMITT